mmetsp:Transcript_25414/g.71359  ORF Transcript_25414/g.71359 Transcript_25414/m.71359 type:complete len:229 (+) Transcript_25414:2769-3455(+)
MQLDQPIQTFNLVGPHGRRDRRGLPRHAVHLELRLGIFHQARIFRRLGHARAARLALLLAQVQVRILLHEVGEDLGLGHEVVEALFALVAGAAVDGAKLLELGQSFLLRASSFGDLGLDVRGDASYDRRDRRLRRLISGGHAGRLGHELLVVISSLLLVRVVLDAVHFHIRIVGLAAGRLGRRRRLLRRRRRFHGACCLFCCPHACALAFHGTTHRVLCLTLSERVAR